MIDFIDKNTPALASSDWRGSKSLQKFNKLSWWKDGTVFVDTTEVRMHTWYDVLDKVCKVNSRSSERIDAHAHSWNLLVPGSL